MITLYQMPVSHYCEKIRWALKYKCLPHSYRNLLPGLHRKKATKLSGQSSLPIIKEGKKIVSNSADIVDYLDAEFPRFLLTPEDPDLAVEAKAWEQWADKEIGPAVRTVIYAEILDLPEIVIPLWTQNGPWYGKFVLNRAYPKVRDAIAEHYVRSPEHVAQCKRVLHEAIKTQLEKQSSLAPTIGSEFSRADLAVASLFAPLFQIGKFGLMWPENLPEGYLNLATEFEAIEPWVKHMYSRYY